MPPKAKSVPPQASSKEDNDYERLEQQIRQINLQTKETVEHLMQQQQEDARKEKEAILKHMEDLISNRLSPWTSLNPTPSATPPPPSNPSNPSDNRPTPIEFPVPQLPPAPHTYERTPTIPSIDKLKGRNNYPTWTINVESHARNLRLWPVIQGQRGT